MAYKVKICKIKNIFLNLLMSGTDVVLEKIFSKDQTKKLKS